MTQRTAKAHQQKATDRINKLKVDCDVDRDVVVALHLMNEILSHSSNPN